MSNVLLCGHTGSQNRGCEAIVRSTTEILKNIDVINHMAAMTFDIEYDKYLGLDKKIELFSYSHMNFFQRIVFFLKRKVFNNQIKSRYYFYKDLMDNMDEQTVLFNIGGDTYCYDTPYLSYTLVELAIKKNVPIVFWGCSVEDYAYTDLQMRDNIDKYSYIVTRESLSYEILKKCVTNKEKVYLACDPAFWLKAKPVDLPEGFVESNTVGINLSPLVFKDCNDPNDIMYQNVGKLIDYILGKTDMNICFIPHVYNVEKGTQDIKVLNTLKSKYKENKRVCMVNSDLSCENLKYIISKCRFFIGARTHAIIAAYSTGVPALALSYSVKSRGIAKDIFGTEEGYAVNWKNIINNDDLLQVFVKKILMHENSIRNLYREKMAVYKESLIQVTKQIFDKLERNDER